MSINPEFIYSIKEASEILGVHPKKLNRIANKHNIQKVDNRFLFEGSFLIEHFDLVDLTDVKTCPEVSKDVSKLVKENEALKEEIKNLKEQLEVFDVGKNKRVEVFTDEEYKILEEQLREWHTLTAEVKHQKEIRKIESKSQAEQLEFYRNQYDYQRLQADKILQMHQKLIDTINQQTNLQLQRNYIEASDKGLNPEQKKKPYTHPDNFR